MFIYKKWSRLMDHLKSGLFGRHLGFYHLKSDLFASIDHCIYKYNFFIHIKWSRLVKMSGFRMAFHNRPTFDHSKVRISDPHCITVFFLLSAGLRLSGHVYSPSIKEWRIDDQISYSEKGVRLHVVNVVLRHQRSSRPLCHVGSRLSTWRTPSLHSAKVFIRLLFLANPRDGVVYTIGIWILGISWVSKWSKVVF